MREEYLLNHIINLLLEYRLPVHYETSNPVIFSFEYSGYKFYLVWDIESMSNEDIHLVYRSYLNHMNCSLHEILIYIEHIRDEEEHIEIKLTENYIAYVDSLSISPEYFTYEILFKELKSFINLLSRMEIHIQEVRERIDNAVRGHEERILEQKQ